MPKSFVKCGAVFQTEARDWFSEHDSAHVLGFLQFEKTGRWPASLVDSTIWFLDNGWEGELRSRIAAQPLAPEVKQYMNEYERISSIVNEAHFPGYLFSVEPASDHFLVKVSHWTGPGEEKQDGEFLVRQHELSHVIVTRCFEAVRCGLESWARTMFLYQGKDVFNLEKLPCSEPSVLSCSSSP